MPEPTLKEIEQVAVDPDLGGGSPSVVDNSMATVNLVNQNAQFKANNDWRKYQQFLGDYQDRLRNIQDIADKPIADSDREYLKKRAVDLLSSGLSNPTKIYSPEFNSELANLRADSVSSKQARDYAENTIKHMVLNPSMNTDENKALVKDYLDEQTIEKGGRKTFMLDLPEVIDTEKYFGGLKDLTKSTIDASYISPDNQFIHERQDTKYGYKPFLELIKAGYDSDPKIRKKAKADFDSLPADVKSNFEDPKDYWLNFGSKHFGAYDDIINQGKENIQPNSNYLKDKELALKRDKLGIERMKANAYVKKVNADLNDDEKGAVSYWGSIIDSLQPATVGDDATVVAMAGNVPKAFSNVGGIVYNRETGKYSPASISPYKSSGNVKEFWKPKFINNSNGQEISFKDLKTQAEANFGRKLSDAEAANAIKYLLKNTDAYSLEISGEGGSTANLESATQSARLINNATKKKGQEGALEPPINDETE